MGTWGPEPFSSDLAQDLLFGVLAEMSAPERDKEVQRIRANAANDPNSAEVLGPGGLWLQGWRDPADEAAAASEAANMRAVLQAVLA